MAGSCHDKNNLVVAHTVWIGENGRHSSQCMKRPIPSGAGWIAIIVISRLGCRIGFWNVSRFWPEGSFSPFSLRARLASVDRRASPKIKSGCCGVLGWAGTGMTLRISVPLLLSPRQDYPQNCRKYRARIGYRTCRSSHSHGLAHSLARCRCGGSSISSSRCPCGRRRGVANR